MTRATFHPRRVGVVGDGPAALLAALALAEWRPELDVTVLRAGDAPDVAFADTTGASALPFLHGWLGIDAHRFHRDVRPTWRLGTRYGRRPDGADFVALAGGDLGDALAHDGDLARYCLEAQLMRRGAAPVVSLAGTVRSLLPQTRMGYHLDPGRLEAYLARRAATAGVHVRGDRVTDVVVGADGHVDAVRTDAGATVAADLWIDASGPDATLLGVALHVERRPFPRVRADAAVVAWCDRRGPAPVATALTHLAGGWAWSVPLREGDRVGYAHARGDVSADEAVAALRARFPDLRDAALVPLAQGRRVDALRANVFAVGDAYGVVAPLVSGGLDMAILHITGLLGLLASPDPNPAQLNAALGAAWDRVAGLTGLHGGGYEAPDGDAAPPPAVGEDAGGAPRADALAAALGVAASAPDATVSGADWEALATMRQVAADHALSHADALALATEDRAILDDLVYNEESWCQRDAAALHAASPASGRSPRALAAWVAGEGLQARLPPGLGRGPATFPESPCLDFGKLVYQVPDAVLRPRSQGELARCLAELQRRRIPYKTRAAGHTSGGQTLIEDGVVVDLRWLQRVVDDRPDEGLVTVEAGAWWLEVTAHLRPTGRAPRILTLNARSTVGGTLATGGFGDTTHHHGLQLAMVRAMKVMTPDGRSHRVRPGDSLFDYSLAGRGQIALITEVTLETILRSTEAGRVGARVVGWRSVDDWLADLPRLLEPGRFDIVRTRLFWDSGEVRGALGGFGAGILDTQRACAPLRARVGRFETVNYYEDLAHPPTKHWLPPCPAVELVFPFDPADPDAASRVLATVRQRVLAADLARHLPLGTSLMVLPTAGHPPLAPLPASPFALMLAIRPEAPADDLAAVTLATRGLLSLIWELDAKLYLVGLEPEPGGQDDGHDWPRWIERQLGPAADTWRALKREHDPHGLMNPGLLRPWPPG